MVTQNLGKLDRIFRFGLGIWWLSPLAPQFNVNGVNWIIFIVGWIALAESFAGWCLIHKLIHINNKNQ
ncbi:TPA: DUF2892 domain-containing protein [Candidatus Woesearchaeota archaeon]|nr:DUF2892 domain-containing protein [Candidatus Woesearchaeota archaeon]